METDEYLRWADFHCSVFGLTPNDAAGVLKWREMFADGGYTTHELALATKRMTLETPAPKFLNEHLGRINGHVKMIKAAMRSEAERKGFSRNEAKDRTYCTRCDDGGFIVVPHPQYVQMGEWVPSHLNDLGMPVRPTAAVRCSCVVGQSKSSRFTSLTDYQKNVHSDPFQLMRMNEPIQPTDGWKGPRTEVKAVAAAMTTPAIAAYIPPQPEADDDRWPECDPEPDYEPF